MALDQLDYGDYHKFKVSLGVACIIAAFVVPWLILREPFDLLIEPDRIGKLDESVRSVIAYRQSVAHWLIWLVPFLSIGFLSLGLVLVLHGLHQWKKVQHWFDREQRLKVQKLQQEIKQMTPVEIEKRAESEVADVERPERVDGSVDLVNDAMKPSERKAAVGHYLAIESQLSRKFEECLMSEYEVLSKRRLEKVEYDLILAAHSQTVLDHVVEIKYAAKNFGRQWVIDNVLKIIMATELYAKATNRKATPAIFFVSPKDLLDRKNTSDYRSIAVKESIRLGSELAIEFIAEESLEHLDCQQVRDLLTHCR